MLSRLPPKVQKAIIGQWILYEVLESHRATLQGTGHGAVWDALTGRVLEHTSLEFENPNDKQTVEDYLICLLGHVDTFPPPKSTAVVCSQIKSELRAAVAGYRQAPEDPLLRDFHTALEVTKEFYRLARIEIPASMMRGVTFEAGWAESRPHAYPAPHQLGGLSTLSPRALYVKVGLTLLPLLLDWKTRLAVPYVLLHELVSHAFVGPWTPGVRAQADADAFFAEGWMDTVAFQVHNNVMDGGLALGSFGSRFGHESECLISARSLHDARYASGEPPQAYAARDLGRETANRVLDTFKRLPETRLDPLNAFWRLSAALNTSALAQLNRRSLVLKLGPPLKRCKLSQAPPVVEALREWDASSRAGTNNQDAWDVALSFARTVDP